MTMSRKISQTFRFWRQLKQDFMAWQDRATLQMEMRNLNERTLRDIGLTRGNERANPSIQPWMK
jgi:uncharacterized protein YjiS (DUF1127 family)